MPRPFLLRRAVPALALFLAGGCINSPIEGPSTIYGRYELLSVNGKAPPARIDSSAAGTTTVQRESITLFRGGTYTDSVFTSSTTPSGGPGPSSTSVEKGVFQTLGVSVTLILGDRQRNMTWAAGKMTFIEAGVTRVYGYQ